MTPIQQKFDFDKVLEAFKPFDTLMDKYYNTTNLSGAELKTRKMWAGSQNDAILQYFKRNPGYLFTPDEIHKVMNLPLTPLTSIRRAITDLTKLGFLEKTKIKKLGNYGSECYCWKLKC